MNRSDVGRQRLLRTFCLVATIAAFITWTITPAGDAAARPASQAFAPLVPEQAIDGAGRVYADLDHPTAPNYVFLIFAFDSADMAIDAETHLNDQISTVGAPIPGKTVLDGPETRDAIGPLADLVDSVTAWRPVITTGNYTIRDSYLVIRDGSLIHVWATIPQQPEVGAATAGASDPDADALVALAEDWFTDSHDGDGLIGHLPGVALMPHGYAEQMHAESLAELRGGRSATPSA